MANKNYDSADPEENGNPGLFTEGKEEKGKTSPQFLAAIAGNLAAVITGCIIGWTSPASVKLKDKENSPISGGITDEQDSWISSLMPLSAAVGPFAAGYATKLLGRKKGLLIISVPALVSWICLAAADSVGLIYFARLLAGFCVGWVFTILPMYCGEISSDTVRGAIGSLMQLFIVAGLLFDYCIGPYVPYMWLSIGAAIIPVLFVGCFLFMPESPYYLLEKGDKDGARKSLKWLRGKSSDGVAQELKNMQADVDQAQSQSGGLKDLFATKGTTKALILSCGLVGFQQFSGINVVLFNAQTIFGKAGGAKGGLGPDISTIITGVVMGLASFSTPLIVDRLGRRMLFLISASGMGIAQAVLGLCFFLDTRQHVDTSSFSFLPVVAVIVYIIVYSIGFGPLPWAVMGEMFPANIKPLASTLTASFCWILGFLITRFFNDLANAIGMDYTFWIFAIFCAFAIPFVFLLLPETKGKSLVEIQEILNR